MKLPKSWRDISLKQYMEVSEVSQVDMDEIDKHVKILSVLSGECENVILSLSLDVLRASIKSIAFIYTMPNTSGVPTHVKINGTRFYVNNNVRDLTGGEFITYSELTKDRSKITENLPDIICLFLKPVNLLGKKITSHYEKNSQGKYARTLDSYKITAELIRNHLSMDVVMQLSGFFLRSYEASVKATQDYLVKQTKKNTKMIARMLDS